MVRHDPDKLIDFIVGFGFEPARRDDEWESESCPVCMSDEKKGRVWVNVARGLVNCYSCGGRKNIFAWVMDVDGCTFREAKALIGANEEKHYDADLINEVFAPDPTTPALQWPSLPFHEVSWLGPDVVPAGWGHDAVEASRARGFDLDWLRLKACGLGASGRWHGRLILPAFYQQQMVWWQGWDWTRRSDIKYDSPPVPKGVLGRRHILFQWDLYWRSASIVLAEGVYNSWAAEQVGWPAMASFGKALSPEQMGLLLASPVQTIVIAFDADAADRASAIAWDLIEIGKRALVIRYPDDRDLNDHSPADRSTLLAEATPPDWLPETVTKRNSLRASR